MAEVSIPTKFVPTVNTHLICVLCRGVFVEPVINVKCGHTYCRPCIYQSSADKQRAECPHDSLSCQLDSLILNQSLANQIADLDIYCRYGTHYCQDQGEYVVDSSGCQKIIKLGKRSQHEEICEFRLVCCPNSEKCGEIQLRSLEHHMVICPNHGCDNIKKGCSYRGCQKDVAQHKTKCIFNDSQPNHINLNPSENGLLGGELKALQSRVSQLEAENQTLREMFTQCQRQLSDMTDKYTSLGDKVDRLTVSPSTSTSPQRITSALTPSPGSPRAAPFSRDDPWTMPFQVKCIGTLRGHKRGVMALLTTQSLLFSAGADRVIKVWDLEGLAKGCTRTLEGHTDTINCLCLGTDRLYSAGADFSIRTWKVQGKDVTQESVVENAHENVITTLVCTKNHIFSASLTVIKVWMWNEVTLETVHTMLGLKHWVKCLALNTSKDRLYSGSHNTIDIWDTVEPFRLKGRISHTFGSVHSLAVTNQYIIAGTYNHNTQIFSVSGQQHVHKLSGHVGAINSLAVTPSGKFLFTGSNDKIVQVWSLEKLLPIQPLSRHEEQVNVVALHRDLILSGSDDTEIKVFKYFKFQLGLPT